MGKKKRQDNDQILYLGYWGNLKALQLRDKFPRKYKFLVDNNMLEPFLDNFQELYSLRADQLREKLCKKHGVDDALFERNSIDWMTERFLIEKKIRWFLTRKILKSS